MTKTLEEGMSDYLKKNPTMINSNVVYHYNAIPNAVLENVVIPFDRIHSDFRKFMDHRMSPEVISQNPLSYREGTSWGSPLVNYDLDKEVAEFISSAKMATSSMAASFKRKMQAHISRRVQVSKTGRLNMDIIHTYKYNDDLFLGSSFIPKGKNHGMIMFIDWSGSMSPYINETIRQMMNLVMFCRSVKIPFRVYAFTDQPYDPNYFMNDDGSFDKKKFWDDCSDGGEIRISPNGSPYARMSNFHLMELFSNEMNSIQFNDAIRNMVFWGDCIGGKHLSVQGFIPSYFNFGGTPLTECIVAGISVARNFRNKYNCEILNTVFLTDGEGSANNLINNKYGGTIRYNSAKFIAEFEGRTYEVDGYCLDKTCLSIYRDATQSRVIGFYLTAPAYAKRIIGYAHSDGSTRERKEKDFRSNGYVQIDQKHYDVYYLMQANSDTMSLDDVFSKISSTGDTKKTIGDFVKSANNRAKSRILLNNFAEIVAQDIKF